jgi:lysine/ornithine N-monooxygenase
MNAKANDDLRRELAAAGVRDSHSEQAFASGVTAVGCGMPAAEVVAYLVKNRADLFTRQARGGSACENLRKRGSKYRA